MKRISIKKIISFVLSMAMIVSLTACQSNADISSAEKKFTFFYLNPDVDSLVSYEGVLDLDSYETGEAKLAAVVKRLSESPDMAKMRAPLGPESGFVSAVLVDTQAVIDFDYDMGQRDVLTRTLVMAAVTRTITQLPEIDSVLGMVEGSPMLDSKGMVLGPLSAETFLDNTGLQINPEEKTQLTLYFANESGDGLVKVNRTVVYSGNISMDKLVVRQLLEGPHEDEAGYPVMNPQTKIINVTTQDGTCYVNLDTSFLAPPNNLTNDVAIYSIVDSLIELGSVNKVQFLIDSDSDVMFRETVSLNTQFDRNLDIVE
ncbi:MAG: GerMN domain-containing protein [Lachnospiraceae bacterium]|nr:GerMN domain-containing protein [Lachnospiraceae bacterium]